MSAHIRSCSFIFSCDVRIDNTSCWFILSRVLVVVPSFCRCAICCFLFPSILFPRHYFTFSLLVAPERLRTVLTTQSALSPRAGDSLLRLASYLLPLSSLLGMTASVRMPVISLPSPFCPHDPCPFSCAPCQNIMATAPHHALARITSKIYTHHRSSVYQSSLRQYTTPTRPSPPHLSAS